MRFCNECDKRPKHHRGFHKKVSLAMSLRAAIAVAGVVGAVVLVALAATKKPCPPPLMSQALSDVYVNATTSADLEVSLPPGAAQAAFTLFAREDGPSNPWSQCINNQICPIQLAGFQDCKLRGADPRDGAPKYGCLFRNNADRARRARLVVTYKQTQLCCKP